MSKIIYDEDITSGFIEDYIKSEKDYVSLFGYTLDEQYKMKDTSTATKFSFNVYPYEYLSPQDIKSGEKYKIIEKKYGKKYKITELLDPDRKPINILKYNCI